ncbi:hypothetical protein GGR57DRAFT_510971 [Xylariaceae sp. FL1272]|nr:hypothetical protein GGR57DRAFT_510971 [Xylariaceae sp. FL1272]
MDLTAATSMIAVSQREYAKSSNNFGHSCLHEALFQTGANDAWQGVIQSLVEMYDLEELQDPSQPTGTFLGQAVQHGSLPPIHVCISLFGSAEMLALLVKYGTDLSVRHDFLGATPVQSIVLGGGRQRQLFDTIVGYDMDSQIYVEALATALTLNVGRHFEGHDRMHYLRSMLEKNKFSKHVNHVFDNGTTLLYKSLFSSGRRQSLDAVGDVGYWPSVRDAVSAKDLMRLKIEEDDEATNNFRIWDGALFLPTDLKNKDLSWGATHDDDSYVSGSLSPCPSYDFEDQASTPLVR